MVQRAVEAGNIASNTAANIDLSILSLIGQADIVVKLVMLFLLFSSFWSWAIIFDKLKSFHKIKKYMSNFEKIFHNNKMLDALYNKINKKQHENPMASMFITAMSEVKYGMLKDVRNPSAALIESSKERIFFAVNRVKHASLQNMEKDLIFLATIGSAAPFVGLFGTVWGIVNSFQAIGATNNTSLAVVAPGIAEALIATAMGLLAAIPAVMFYNLFSNQIRLTASQLEDFQGELTNIIYTGIKK